MWVAWVHPPAQGGCPTEWYAPERKSRTIGRLIEKGKLPFGTVVIGKWGKPAGNNLPPYRGDSVDVSGERRGKYQGFKRKLWGSNVHEILLDGDEGSPGEVIKVILKGEWWVLGRDGSLRMMTKNDREEEWEAAAKDAWARVHHHKIRTGQRVIPAPPFSRLAAISNNWGGRDLPDGPLRPNFLLDPRNMYLPAWARKDGGRDGALLGYDEGEAHPERVDGRGGGDKRNKPKRNKPKRKRSKRKESRRKSNIRKSNRRRKSKKRRKTKRRKSRRCH